jgi:hypothetical protein
MAYYYKYNFVSPEPVFSIIREEFKSYYDTGAIDDLMFLTWLNKALNKLGKSSYIISEEILYIEDFQARLPDNFYAVREAWACTEIPGYPYQTANSFYSQAASASTIQISPMIIDGQPCNDPVCPSEYCDPCMPNLVQAIYKTNNEFARTFHKDYLLKPGNISVKIYCDVEYTSAWDALPNTSNIHRSTPFSTSYDSFDIRDNKFTTNFRNGTVHLIFYATEYDNVGNQMIPDNYRIKEYVEAFIKFKLMEMLTNQITDETFAQLQQKLAYYKQAYEEAYILADIEIKKQGMWEKQRRIKQDLNRSNMYELPGNVNRYARRRNS